MRLLLTVLIVSAFLIGCGSRDDAVASKANGASTDTGTSATAQTAAVGAWTWSNSRQGFLLDMKIPAGHRLGQREHRVELLANGRATYAVNVAGVEAPLEGVWGGTWAMDRHRDNTIDLTFDQLPEPPGPKLGIKGELHVLFKLEQLAGTWFLVRPIDDGYLTFIRP